MSPRSSDGTRNGPTCSRRPTADRSAGQAREVDPGDRMQHPVAEQARVLERNSLDRQRAAGDAEMQRRVTAPPRDRALRDLDRLQLDPRGDVEAWREPAAAHVDPFDIDRVAV